MATTFTASFPFAGAVTTAQWREFAPHLGMRDGVIAELDDALEVFGDNSSLSVKVRGGSSMMQAIYGRLDSQQTLALGGTIPSSGQSRIARVVVRNDLLNSRVELDVLSGTNATTPTVPTLTQNSSVWEMSLAQVRVTSGGGAIAPEAVTDERTFARSRTGWAPGDIRIWPVEAGIPTGWLVCDGSAVSRVTYAELYEFLAEEHGSGDGSTTFNIPDYRGEVLAGLDAMGSGAAGRLSSMGFFFQHYGAQNVTPSYTQTFVANGGDKQVTQYVNSSSVIQPTHMVVYLIAGRPAA